MRARQLEMLLAAYGPRSASEMDARGRFLRKAGFISAGGRGPYAPSITPREATIIFVAAAGSVDTPRTIETVETFERCVFHPGEAVNANEDCSVRFCKSENFFDALSSVIESPTSFPNPLRVTLYHPFRYHGILSPPFVGFRWVEYDRGPTVYSNVYRQRDVETDLPRWTSYYDCTVLSPTMLTLISNAIKLEFTDDEFSKYLRTAGKL